MKPIKDVDEYIRNAPEDIQNRLKELRAVVKDAAPNAEERISYGMPYYYYKGRLVYFNLWKKHIGLYAISLPIRDKYKNELKGYVTAKGTIRFPLDEKLPISLIKKLIKDQVKKNSKTIKKEVKG